MFTYYFCANGNFFYVNELSKWWPFFVYIKRWCFCTNLYFYLYLLSVFKVSGVSSWQLAHVFPRLVDHVISVCAWVRVCLLRFPSWFCFFCETSVYIRRSCFFLYFPILLVRFFPISSSHHIPTCSLFFACIIRAQKWLGLEAMTSLQMLSYKKQHLTNNFLIVVAVCVIFLVVNQWPRLKCYTSFWYKIIKI